jgi:hypothetical protein
MYKKRFGQGHSIELLKIIPKKFTLNFSEVYYDFLTLNNFSRI